MLTESTDQFTGETTTGFNEPFILSLQEGSETVFDGVYVHAKGQRYLIFTSGGLSCTDGNSYVILKFNDGSTLKLINIGDFECDKTITINLRYRTIGEQPTKNIYEKKITAIRLSGYSEFVDIEIDEEMSSDILAALRCLSNAG